MNQKGASFDYLISHSSNWRQRILSAQAQSASARDVQRSNLQVDEVETAGVF